MSWTVHLSSVLIFVLSSAKIWAANLFNCPALAPGNDWLAVSHATVLSSVSDIFSLLYSLINLNYLIRFVKCLKVCFGDLPHFLAVFEIIIAPFLTRKRYLAQIIEKRDQNGLAALFTGFPAAILGDDPEMNTVHSLHFHHSYISAIFSVRVAVCTASFMTLSISPPL